MKKYIKIITYIFIAFILQQVQELIGLSNPVGWTVFAGLALCTVKFKIY